uniref:Lipocalin n=1 Tax=Rhipicephalus appendiculatus TaxID=34631 RepID=A0A131Z6T9_RHIAP
MFKYSGDWQSMEQGFRFLGESGPYNTMTPTVDGGKTEQQQVVDQTEDGSEDAGSLIVPSGNYTFKFFKENCAVIEVALAEIDDDTEDKNSGSGNSQTDSVAAREDTNAETAKPPCMLWVKKDSGEADSCCEDYFRNHCGDQDPKYIGSGDQCKDEASPSSQKK